MNDRVMPDRIDLGRGFESCIGEAMLHWRDFKLLNHDTVMGYIVPLWQRPLVWTSEQNIKLIESMWLGLPIGTYTFNRKWGSKFDNLLIDGQQRMNAIQCYLSDEFSVFGYKWSETTKVDKRFFRSGVRFASYITETNDEEYLKGYYNMMNFGGTAHKESERA